MNLYARQVIGMAVLDKPDATQHLNAVSQYINKSTIAKDKNT